MTRFPVEDLDHSSQLGRGFQTCCETTRMIMNPHYRRSREESVGRLLQAWRRFKDGKFLHFFFLVERKKISVINGRKYRRFRLNQKQKALSMSFMHGKNCLPLYYYQSNCVHLSASKWHWAHREKQREREGKTGTYKQRLESAVYQRDTGKTPKYHFLEAQKNETQENNVYKS